MGALRRRIQQLAINYAWGDATKGSKHLQSLAKGVDNVTFWKGKPLTSSDNRERGTFFGYQIAGAVVIIALCSFIFVCLFIVLKNINCLRVGKVIEILGFDSAEAGHISN